jgi:hypothetical protein
MYRYIKLKNITLNAYLYIDRYYNIEELSKTIRVSNSDYDSILKAIHNNR